MNRYGVLTKGSAEGVSGRVRDALQGAEGVRGGGPLPARLLRRVVGRRPVRDRVDGRPAARPLRRRRRRSAATTRPSRWRLPTPPTPTARRCRGRPTPMLGHRPGRKAGALVVLVDGELVWFLERGGRSLLSFSADAEAHAAAAAALAELVSAGACSRCWSSGSTVCRCSSQTPTAVAPSVHDALTGSGFSRTPRGLRLRWHGPSQR